MHLCHFVPRHVDVHGNGHLTWRSDLYQEEAFRQLSDKSFYAKVDKELTLTNQKLVKETIQDLISKQELPAMAQNLIITTPRTLRIYFKPKIHKPNNPGRPMFLHAVAQLNLSPTI